MGDPSLFIWISIYVCMLYTRTHARMKETDGINILKRMSKMDYVCLPKRSHCNWKMCAKCISIWAACVSFSTFFLFCANGLSERKRK